MPNSGQNVRFQVFVNGEPKATAGIESAGVLVMNLTWVRDDPDAALKEDKSGPKRGTQESDGPNMFVRLGGLDSAKDQHMTWFVRDLQVGDEITVRVLPPGEFDKPAKKHRRTAEAGGPHPKPTLRGRSTGKEKQPMKRKGRT